MIKAGLQSGTKRQAAYLAIDQTAGKGEYFSLRKRAFSFRDPWHSVLACADVFGCGTAGVGGRDADLMGQPGIVVPATKSRLWGWTMKAVTLGLAACLSLGLTTICRAENMVAAEQVGGTSVGFVLKGAYSNATLTVAGPGNFQARTFSRGGAVALDLKKFGALPDGTYNYELTAASNRTVQVSRGLDDGRGSARKTAPQTPASKSGTFNVKGGKIVDYGVPARTRRRDSDGQ